MCIFFRDCMYPLLFARNPKYPIVNSVETQGVHTKTERSPTNDLQLMSDSHSSKNDVQGSDVMPFSVSLRPAWTRKEYKNIAVNNNSNNNSNNNNNNHEGNGSSRVTDGDTCAMTVIDQSKVMLGESSLLKWTDYNRVYESMYKNFDFPPPSCLYISENYISVGTSKANIMIFNYNQFVMHIMVPEDQDFRSPITKIVISYDGTHIAAACISGDVLIWDLNEPKILDENSNQVIPSVLHIDYHRGYTIKSMGFVADKNNAISVCAVNRKGDVKVTYHHGAKSKMWANQTPKLESTDIPIVAPANSVARNLVLAEPLPIPLPSNAHIIAILKSRSLRICAINSASGVLYAKRFKEHATFLGDLVWNKFDLGGSIYFSRGSLLYYYKFNQEEPSGYELIIERSFDCQEPIIKIAPINRFLTTVLTASGRVLVIDIFVNESTSCVVFKMDLSTANMINPVSQSLSCVGSQMAMLTRGGLKIGRLSSWSSIILLYLQSSNPFSALDFLFKLSQKENDSLCSFLNLPEDTNRRKHDLGDTFRSLLLASIQYFNKNLQAEFDTSKLALFFNQSVYLDRYFHGPEMKMSQIIDDAQLSSELKTSFYEACLKLIGDWDCTNLEYFPPTIVQHLLAYTVQNAQEDKVCDLVFKLSPACYDIDKVIHSLNDLQLYETVVFVWNSVFQDYITPLVEMFYLLSDHHQPTPFFKDIEPHRLKSVFFSYLAAVMRGRVYPTETSVADEARSTETKEQVLQFVFSATIFTWPTGTSKKIYTTKSIDSEPVFPYFKFLLQYDIDYCLSWLRNCFEDSFFNTVGSSARGSGAFQINRQYVVDILMDITKDETEERMSGDSIKLIAVFVALAFSTFQQFVVLSTKSLEHIVKILSKDEIHKNYSEIGLQSIINNEVARLDLEKYVGVLDKNGYYDALFDIHYRNKSYLKCLRVFYEHKQPRRKAVPVIQKLVESAHDDAITMHELCDMLAANFDRTVCENPIQMAQIIDEWFPDLHTCALDMGADNEEPKFQYMSKVVEMCSARKAYVPGDILIAYLELLANKPNTDTELETILNVLEVNTANVEKISKILKQTKRVKLLVKFLVKHKMFAAAMDEVVENLDALFARGHLDKDQILELTELGLNICHQSGTVDLWSKLFLKAFVAFHDTSDGQTKSVCLLMVDQILIRLTLVYENGHDVSVLEVLTRVLEDKALILSKAQTSQPLLNSLFQMYELERSMDECTLAVFNKESSGLIDNYINKSVRGWLLLNQECKGCSDKIYGSFASVSQETQSDLVVFRSGHGYHERCVPKDSPLAPSETATSERVNT